ncbi:MAG: hypothetical protein ACYDH4_11365 [Candidatus Cryosericum sp.]
MKKRRNISLAKRRAALRAAYPGRDTSGWDVNAYDAKVERILHKRTKVRGSR